MGLVLLALVVGSSGWAAPANGGKGPTFHEDVAPILFKHCLPCHRERGAGPFPLAGLAEARKHAREMVDVTARRFMPPWLPEGGHGEFEGERWLSDGEIGTIRKWVEGGMAEGDGAKAPPVPVWTSDWDLGPPDLIVRMPESYTLPAEGRDVYRHFVMPVRLDRRRYVRAWQFRPNSRTVHHAFVRLDRSGEGRRRDAFDAAPGFPGMDTPQGLETPGGHFSSWQPGAAPRQIPAGLSWALDPDVDVVVQMHLQPRGRPEPLAAEIGFYFTDQPPTRRPIKVALVNYAIDLPPGAREVAVRDEFVLPGAAQLLAVLPHTHYLGRRVEARAFLPGGGVRSLLLIRDWDFNWQGDYVYREPVRLPAGTRVAMEIVFDNTEDNPRNPSHPPRRVGYGPETTDEMAELWLQLLPESPEDERRLLAANAERSLRDVVAVNELRLRQDPRDGAAWVNLGKAHLARRQFDEARRKFARAVEATPGFADAHYYLGLIHRMTGRTEEAMGSFRRALELDAGNPRIHGNLGMLFLETSRPAEAMQHLKEAVRLDPKDALAMSSLGALYFEQGRHAEAEPLLRRALERDPADAETRGLLGRTREILARGQVGK